MHFDNHIMAENTKEINKIKSKAIQYWNKRHCNGEWKGNAKLSQFGRWLKPGQVVVELGVGAGPDISIPGFYVGLDLAFEGLRKFIISNNGVCCDVETIPLRSQCADLIFSMDVLEHIPDPGKVVEECCRIIRKGGIIIHSDAWFRRKWVAEGLFYTADNKNIKSRLARTYTRLLERKIFRWPRILIGRILREFRWKFLIGKKNLEFKYFKPNWDDFLESDSDACAAIDPHAVMLFYQERGFEIIRSRGFFRRLIHRKHVIVRKRF